MEAFRDVDYGVIPMYFMALGRQVCKARRPLCPKCPLNSLCPYESKTRQI